MRFHRRVGRGAASVGPLTMLVVGPIWLALWIALAVVVLAGYALLALVAVAIGSYLRISEREDPERAGWWSYVVASWRLVRGRLRRRRLTLRLARP